MSMRTVFTATIKIRSGNPYIPVDASRAATIKEGWRKPLPVRLRINGLPRKAWRVNMMPVGDGSFYLYLHGAIREASGTAVGDRVDLEVAFDPRYRGGPQHRMPLWFKRGFASNPQALKNWKALAPSRRKEVLRYFSRLVSAEARARNLAKALHVLSGEPGRFMARDWKHGV
jgi:hypothetical protein